MATKVPFLNNTSAHLVTSDSDYEEICDMPLRQAASAWVVAHVAVPTTQSSYPMPPDGTAIGVLVDLRQPRGGLHQERPLAGLGNCERHASRNLDEANPQVQMGGIACGDLTWHHFHIGHESIADPSNGLDHVLSFAAVSDCLTCALDPAGERGLGDESCAPYGVKQLGLGYDTITVLGEMPQNVEDLLLDMHWA